MLTHVTVSHMVQIDLGMYLTAYLMSLKNLDISEIVFQSNVNLPFWMTGLYIRTEKWAEAVGVLLRFAAACDATNATVSQCKAYLGAVVVWLYANDGAQAWAVYQASASPLHLSPCVYV